MGGRVADERGSRHRLWGQTAAGSDQQPTEPPSQLTGTTAGWPRVPPQEFEPLRGEDLPSLDVHRLHSRLLIFT
jgi:hypothetical protein